MSFQFYKMSFCDYMYFADNSHVSISPPHQTREYYGQHLNNSSENKWFKWVVLNCFLNWVSQYTESLSSLFFLILRLLFHSFDYAVTIKVGVALFLELM